MAYNGDFPDHSYEEIRKATIDILARRWSVKVPDHYNYLREAVGNLLHTGTGKWITDSNDTMSKNDNNTFLEIFWDLFRQGVVTLGRDDKTREFPYFRVSAHGKRILENQNVYFYHDVSSYETIIKEQVPDIDPITLLYLKEAMQTFYSGCYLSSSVMLGVASENAFLKLLEAVENNTKYDSIFRKALNGKSISQKFEAFKYRLKQEIGNNNITLPHEIQENLDSNLDGIMNTIRRFRNDSGHPSGNMISREQCYINLNLFIPYCKTAYGLIRYFSNVVP